MDNFVKTTNNIKKLDEVDDAEKIIQMKKNVFEAWLAMVFMRGSYKRKDWELIHDVSIQYVIKNNQNTKTLQ